MSERDPYDLIPLTDPQHAVLRGIRAGTIRWVAPITRRYLKERGLITYESKGGGACKNFVITELGQKVLAIDEEYRAKLKRLNKDEEKIIRRVVRGR